MKVTVTGATGLIGKRLVSRLKERGDDVTVLSRDADRARAALDGVMAFTWEPLEQTAPGGALAGRDAVIHLAGEDIAQRWSSESKRKIMESRTKGTAHLVDGLRAVSDDERPRVLVSSSGVGYYGHRGDEKIDESASPGDDFAAEVCKAWEAAAGRASGLGVRVVCVRTGVVLDKGGGALAKMLPPFKLGAGGPVAGGDQYLPWIHLDDIVGLMLAAIDDDGYNGPVNATAPEPVTNREFSKALGRALKRPAFAPVPGFAIKLLYGEMAEIVTSGQRAVPAKATARGFSYQHPALDEALRSALRR